MINFIENGFAKLPWVLEDDPVEIGNDLLAEIAESFDVIKDYIRLTPLGESAVQHFLQLFDCYRSRWSKIVCKAD